MAYNDSVTGRKDDQLLVKNNEEIMDGGPRLNNDVIVLVPSDHEVYIWKFASKCQAVRKRIVDKLKVEVSFTDKGHIEFRGNLRGKNESDLRDVIEQSCKDVKSHVFSYNAEDTDDITADVDTLRNRRITKKRPLNPYNTEDASIYMEEKGERGKLQLIVLDAYYKMCLDDINHILKKYGRKDEASQTKSHLSRSSNEMQQPKMDYVSLNCEEWKFLYLQKSGNYIANLESKYGVEISIRDKTTLVIHGGNQGNIVPPFTELYEVLNNLVQLVADKDNQYIWRFALSCPQVALKIKDNIGQNSFIEIDETGTIVVQFKTEKIKREEELKDLLDTVCRDVRTRAFFFDRKAQADIEQDVEFLKKRKPTELRPENPFESKKAETYIMQSNQREQRNLLLVAMDTCFKLCCHDISGIIDKYQADSLKQADSGSNKVGIQSDKNRDDVNKDNEDREKYDQLQHPIRPEEVKPSASVDCELWKFDCLKRIPECKVYVEKKCKVRLEMQNETLLIYGEKRSDIEQARAYIRRVLKSLVTEVHAVGMDVYESLETDEDCRSRLEIFEEKYHVAMKLGKAIDYEIDVQTCVDGVLVILTMELVQDYAVIVELKKSKEGLKYIADGQVINATNLNDVVVILIEKSRDESLVLSLDSFEGQKQDMMVLVSNFITSLRDYLETGAVCILYLWTKEAQTFLLMKKSLMNYDQTVEHNESSVHLQNDPSDDYLEHCIVISGKRIDVTKAMMQLEEELLSPLRPKGKISRNLEKNASQYAGLLGTKIRTHTSDGMENSGHQTSTEEPKDFYVVKCDTKLDHKRSEIDNHDDDEDDDNDDDKTFEKKIFNRESGDISRKDDTPLKAMDTSYNTSDEYRTDSICNTSDVYHTGVNQDEGAAPKVPALSLDKSISRKAETQVKAMGSFYNTSDEYHRGLAPEEWDVPKVSALQQNGGAIPKKPGTSSKDSPYKLIGSLADTDDFRHPKEEFVEYVPQVKMDKPEDRLCKNEEKPGELGIEDYGSESNSDGGSDDDYEEIDPNYEQHIFEQTLTKCSIAGKGSKCMKNVRKEVFMLMKIYFKFDWDVVTDDCQVDFCEGEITINGADHKKMVKAQTFIKSAVSVLDEYYYFELVSNKPAPEVFEAANQVKDTASMENVYIFEDDGIVRLAGSSFEMVDELIKLVKKKLEGNSPSSRANRIFQWIQRKDTTDDGNLQLEISFKNNPNDNRQGKQFNPKSKPGCKTFITNEGLRIYVYKANILHLEVDCIVNAANSSMKHGEGIAKIIADAAGPELKKESRDFIERNGNIQVGCSCVTSAGRLCYQHMIHTVGPCITDYSKEEVGQLNKDLYDAIYSSLEEAKNYQMMSIGVPSVSSGIFGVPKKWCASQYCLAVRDFSKANWDCCVREVHFIDIDEEMLDVIGLTCDVVFNESKKAGRKLKQLQCTKNENAMAKVRGFLKLKKNVRTQLKPDSYPRIGRSLKSKIKLEITAGLQVSVRKDNIVNLEKGVIVCPQDHRLSCEGGVARAIRDQDYYFKGNLLTKFSRKSYATGEILVSVPKCLRCKIYNIIVPQGRMNVDKDFTSLCYMQVLQKADQNGEEKIALPLLSAGNRHMTQESAKIIAEAVTEFQHSKERNHKFPHIYIYDKDKEVIEILIDVLKAHFIDGQQHRRKPESDFYGRRRNHNENVRRKSKTKGTTSKPHYMHDNTPPSSPNLDERPPNLQGFHRQTSRDSKASRDSEISEDSEGFDTSEEASDRWQEERVEENQKEDEAEKEVKSKRPDGSLESMKCEICMDSFTNPKTLSKCGHTFCTDCIDNYFKIKPVCPFCFTTYGVVTGTQPYGTMHPETQHYIHLPGYERCKTIVIRYNFPDGIQNVRQVFIFLMIIQIPGQRYHGTRRTAYLPDNKEGRKVLKLLTVAFDRKLVFTIGRSVTTGIENVVTWNDIHHKTNREGGSDNYGYPDPDYLTRVTAELATKGVTEADIV